MAEDYTALGRPMARTVFPEAAAGAFDTAAVLFDEDHGLGERALAVLDEASNLLGNRPILMRARARVLHHMGNYEEQLAIAGSMNQEPDGEPVPQAFFLRETAIATSLMGRHKEAAGLFGKGARIAQRTEGDAMRAMGVGLQVDSATERYRAGDKPAALGELRDALVRIEAFDLTQDGPAVAVHAILAHCAMVMRNETSCRPANLPDISGLVSGAASNPVPAKELTRPKPPKFLRLVWYQLAILEQGWELSLGIANQVMSAEFEHELPTIMHATLVIEAFTAALRRRSAVDTASLATPAARAQAFVTTFRRAGIELTRSGSGPLPDLSLEPSEDHTGELQFWLLAVLCDIALTAGAATADHLLDCLEVEDKGIFPTRVYGIMRDGSPPAFKDQVGNLACVGTLLQQVRSSTPLALDRLCVVTLRCNELFFSYAAVGGSVVAISQWMKAEWEQAIRTQSFRLKNPSPARPCIETVLAGYRPALGWIIDLITAAAPFMPVRVAQGYLDEMRLRAKHSE